LTSFRLLGLEGPAWNSDSHDGICIEDIETVELQLKHPTRSRTVWIIVPEGQFYIPCGLPDFKAFKQ